MAQYDVYLTPFGPGLLIDVQSDFLDHIQTTVVIPLAEVEDAPLFQERLMPKITVDGAEYVLVTPSMAAVSKKSLQNKTGNLHQYSDDITNALDILFHGF